MSDTEKNEPPSINEALAAVMLEVTAVGKDGKYNAAGVRFDFRGIDAVINAVGPALRRHGVIPAPLLETVSYRDVRTAGDKPSRETTVQVRYRFHGPAKDHIDAVVPGEAMDSGDKGTAKSMSVAYRIALIQVLCLPTNEPDPDTQVYERGQTTEPAWSIEILAAVKANDRPALLRLWDLMHRFQPDNTELREQLVAAGKQVEIAPKDNATSVAEKEAPSSTQVTGPDWEGQLEECRQTLDLDRVRNIREQAGKAGGDSNLLALINATGMEIKEALDELAKTPYDGTMTPEGLSTSKNRRELEKELFVLLREGGITDTVSGRETRLLVVNRILVKVPPVTTTKDLSDYQIAKAILRLRDYRHEGRLTEQLTEMAQVSTS